MGLTVKNVLLEVTGRSEQAQRSVHELAEEVRRLPKDTEFEIGVETRRARDRIGQIRAELRKVDRTKVSPEVNVEITNALVRMDELEARLRRLPNKGTIDFEVRRGILSELAAVERGVVRTVGSLERATAPAQSFGDAVHAVGQKVKQLTPLVNGAGIIILTKLLPGLIALAATAVAAAGAVGGLASAFAGALIPSIALAIPVFSRFGKVLEALKLQDQARDAAAREGIAGTKAAAQASEQRHQAAIGERDAIEQLATAERNLNDAQEAAAKAIAGAERARADAQRAATDSAQALERATVDAYREMQDAAERAADAVRDVEHAQLGVEEAAIGVERAKIALQKFREEAGASGDEISRVFKKFTDVDADVSGLADAIREASSGGLDETDQLDLRQLILDVREAKLREKDATDALGDSETELKRARQDNARFQREGIRASQTYTSAIDANRAAQRSLVDATKELRALEEDGVRKAPAVIAAMESVRDAEQRLAEARRNRRVQALGVDTSAQDDAARVAAAKLSGTESLLLAVLGRVRTFLSQQFQGAVDSVFGGMIRILLAAPLLVLLLRDKIRNLGDAWRDVLGAFAGELISADNVLDMRKLADGAVELAKNLGADAFISFVRLMRNLAVLFMPALIQLSGEFADALRGAAGAAGDAGNEQKWVAPLMTAFRSVVRFLVAGVKLLAEFGRVIGPIGAEFLDWITGLVDGMREWIASAEGQKDIRRFFEDTIPAVKSTIKFLGRLVRIFLKLFQFTAPFVKGFIDAFDFLLSIVEKFIDLLNWIFSNPVGRFVRELLGSFLGFGGVIRLIGRVVGIFGTLAAKLGGLGGIVTKAAEFLIRPFRDAIGAVFRIFGRLAPGLAARVLQAIDAAVRVLGRVGRFIAAGAKLVGGILRGIGSRIGEAAGVAGRFLGRLAGGFASIVGRVLNLGGRILGWVVRGLRDGFSRLTTLATDVVNFLSRAFVRVGGAVFNIGKALLSGLIRGFTTIGREVFDAVKGLGKKIVDAVKDVLGIHSPSRVMYELGQFMLQGLIDGFTSQNVADFIRNKLGGIGKLGAELALSVSPLGAIKRGIGDIQDAIGIDVPLLARGGMAVGPTLAGIGEGAYREAVLPLSRRVMRQLAQAITAQMTTFSGPALAGSARGVSPLAASAVGRDGGIHLHGDIIVKAPAGEQPDGRVVAVKIARELEARGGSPRQS